MVERSVVSPGPLSEVRVLPAPLRRIARAVPFPNHPGGGSRLMGHVALGDARSAEGGNVALFRACADRGGPRRRPGGAQPIRAAIEVGAKRQSGRLWLYR